ncbi:hypothetical protein GCM10023080_078830 [Streptomyces pseudoechinosporeus]
MGEELIEVPLGAKLELGDSDVQRHHDFWDSFSGGEAMVSAVKGPVAARESDGIGSVAAAHSSLMTRTGCVPWNLSKPPLAGCG